MDETSLPETAVVIVAAGRGSRVESSDRAADATPKQYRLLAGRPVLERSIEVFAAHPAIGRIVTVIGEEDGPRAQALRCDPERVTFVMGRASRQASVLAGLRALEPVPPANVLIHDGARPLVASATIDAVVDALNNHIGAIPLLPVTDTIKRTDAGQVTGTLDRDALGAAQTPQGFRFADILNAHGRAGQSGKTGFTDDAAIAAWDGLEIAALPGDVNNIKLTVADDFARAEQILRGGRALETRTGQGFDVHRFVPGDAVILGGVTIPHDAALSGHSDADVLLHAITDAILGAIGDGDIGTHFPPSDDAWKGADSAVFLADAMARLAARGGSVMLIDATVMCETPKIGPWREAIRARIAGITGVAGERISVKATTTERLGFTGRGEGIAVMALATVQLPAPEDRP